MSYLPYIATFLLVISPLLIPIGVTLVHTFRTWRPRQRQAVASGRPHRRPTLAVQFE